MSKEREEDAAGGDFWELGRSEMPPPWVPMYNCCQGTKAPNHDPLGLPLWATDEHLCHRASSAWHSATQQPQWTATLAINPPWHQGGDISEERAFMGKCFNSFLEEHNADLSWASRHTVSAMAAEKPNLPPKQGHKLLNYPKPLPNLAFSILSAGLSMCSVQGVTQMVGWIRTHYAVLLPVNNCRKQCNELQNRKLHILVSTKKVTNMLTKKQKANIFE